MSKTKIALLTSTVSIISFAQLSHGTTGGAGYASPYSVKLDVSLSELQQPDQQDPRNRWQLESRTPFRDWYSDQTAKRFSSWGPEPRIYPPVGNADKLPLEWQRQRLLAVATRWIGLPYQHHHIPDWLPPPDWKWKSVSAGPCTKGLDCSNFSSWVYNYGLGIKPLTNVHHQSDALTVPGPGGVGTIDVERIEGGVPYAELVKQLQTGDLLFIRRQNTDEVSHVVMWVGKYGRSPDGAPLIIDCTDTNRIDSNGVPIPTGVQLRPFKPDTWYFKRFDHASRILH